MCLGIPGQVVAVDDDDGLMGVVDVSGVRRRVDLTCVVGEHAAALIGQWVLVHVGFAMSRIDPAEAERTLDALAALGEAEAEIEAMVEAEAMLEAAS